MKYKLIAGNHIIINRGSLKACLSRGRQLAVQIDPSRQTGADALPQKDLVNKNEDTKATELRRVIAEKSLLGNGLSGIRVIKC